MDPISFCQNSSDLNSSSNPITMEKVLRHLSSLTIRIGLSFYSMKMSIYFQEYLTGSIYQHLLMIWKPGLKKDYVQ